MVGKEFCKNLKFEANDFIFTSKTKLNFHIIYVFIIY